MLCVCVQCTINFIFFLVCFRSFRLLTSRYLPSIHVHCAVCIYGSTVYTLHNLHSRIHLTYDSVLIFISYSNFCIHTPHTHTLTYVIAFVCSKFCISCRCREHLTTQKYLYVCMLFSKKPIKHHTIEGANCTQWHCGTVEWRKYHVDSKMTTLEVRLTFVHRFTCTYTTQYIRHHLIEVLEPIKRSHALEKSSKAKTNVVKH